MSLTHNAVSYLLWVFNTLPPLSSLDHTHAVIFSTLLRLLRLKFNSVHSIARAISYFENHVHWPKIIMERLYQTETVGPVRVVTMIFGNSPSQNINKFLYHGA